MNTSAMPSEHFNKIVDTDTVSKDWDFSTLSYPENTTIYNYYGADGYYYDADEFYDYDFYYFEIYPFEIYALGCGLPMLILLTALSNVFVAGFFLTRKDRRKASSLLFVSIAFSDTLTGLALLPNSLGIYAKNLTFMSREWCYAYMTLRFYVFPVFHTVSVWQTVVLCIQRYLCVCHPLASGRICTFWKTLVCIILMYIAAIILHLYHPLDNKLGHFRCQWGTEIPCKESCIYLWFCVVLQHILPCVFLVVLTVITLLKLGLEQLRGSASRSTQEKKITYTAGLIVLVFLIPELPNCIYKFFFVYNKHIKFNGFSVLTNHIVISVYENVLMVSFCTNFWIYCCMMRDFRPKLLQLLTCGLFGFERSRNNDANNGVFV